MDGENALGEDLWRQILAKLPVPGLAKAACVCRNWRQFAGDPNVIAAAFMAPWKIKAVIGTPTVAAFWKCSGLSCFAISHTVGRSDSVAALAIKYQVQVSEIRRLNNMLSDHGICARDRLLIPVTNPKSLEDKVCYIEMDFHSRREMAVVYPDNAQPAFYAKAQKHRSIFNMKKSVFDSMKRSMKLDSETAQYYLSVADGDFRQAVAELHEDLKWETEESSSKVVK